uniref:NADH-ubiquinone oxidoreductase chain 2 n=1 Tax=Telenomus sp. ZCS-2018 TaxID=2305129 RepID=A0A346PZ62_9HYME|nr:NADH dehydrogenase subunit 2 [Telenomus sp. ZCS-2018]
MYYYPIFLSIILVNLMSILINNWFMMWILMELNLMIFIPLIIEKKNIKIISKISFKYFLIQSFGSMIFLFSILTNLMINNIMNMNLINFFMMTMMLIKLGMFPFQMWFIKMMNCISWDNCFILSTIQKMIPFMIMMNIMNKNLKIFMIINILNSIMSTIGGLNQNFIKPLLAYSSVNHMSWMMIVTLTMEKLFFIYLIIYSINNFMIMKYFKKMNIMFINKIFSMKSSYMTKMIMMMNILSLGGIPPMIGFLIKWMSIFSMYNNIFLNFNMIILLFMSTISVLYYLFLMIPSTLYFNFMPKNKIFKLNFKNFNNYITLFLYFTFSTLMFNNFIY